VRSANERSIRRGPRGHVASPLSVLWRYGAEPHAARAAGSVSGCCGCGAADMTGARMDRGTERRGFLGHGDGLNRAGGRRRCVRALIFPPARMACGGVPSCE
jgi:hypothetical protein